MHGLKRPSALETSMALQLKVAGLPPPVREYRFAPPRRWKADFAWVEQRVLLEVEGGTWAGGRHTRGAGYAADCRKYSEAALLGWVVLRATSEMVKSGEALALVVRALKGGEGE